MRSIVFLIELSLELHFASTLKSNEKLPLSLSFSGFTPQHNCTLVTSITMFSIKPLLMSLTTTLYSLLHHCTKGLFQIRLFLPGITMNVDWLHRCWLASQNQLPLLAGLHVSKNIEKNVPSRHFDKSSTFYKSCL